MLDSGANGGFLRRSGEDAMAVIEESAANSRGWSKERHSMKRIVAIEEAEESSFAKELAELKVRVDQMDTSRKEDPIPPTSIIAVSKIETPVPVVEEINYMQGGGSNRNYNNNYHHNQGAVISIILMEADLILISLILTIITCNPPQDLALVKEE